MEHNSKKVYWVWLSSISGIGAKRFHSLVEHFGSPEEVWLAQEKDITQFSSYLGAGVVQEILKRKNTKALDESNNTISSSDFRVVTLLDEEYPILLKETYDPPPVLYCKGLPINNISPLISIVGSRRSTSYGRQMANKLAYELASAGVTVVSGLARGIDAMAHYGALEAKGATIGILGCGIDRIYPHENSKLFTSMEKEASIVSEYPPGTGPMPGNFPARNRIISGMTKGVLVIEAGTRSGALITADFALDQNREVYALPGNINIAQSQGTNRLLKQGAKLVTSVQDILEDLGMDGGDPQDEGIPLQLDFFETQVYNALQEGEKHLEELSKDANIEISKLNAILTMLEIKGIIKQMPGKIFIKNWYA